MSTQRTLTIGIDASRANRSQRTGVEWYAFHLIQRLKTIVPSEFRVLLYSEEPLRDGLEKLPPNWESRVLRWPPRRLWTQGRLSLEMLMRPPHLLFVPAFVPPMLTPKRVLTTLHDVAFVPMPQAYKLLGRMYLRLMYHVSLWAGRILTVSEFSKREIIKYFHAKPEQITVTPLGFDADRYHVPTEAEVADCLGRYGVTQPYFVFVGRLETKKNLRGLLEAFRRYRQERPNEDTKLVLVGKPGHGFDQDMRSMGGDIRQKVLQLGYVAPEDMSAVYGGAVAFVFASHYEGFGIPLLEAFATGTPVIGSSVTSIPEIAGDAALYVDPKDPKEIARAMARLADDAALRDSLRQKGFVRAKEFSWDKTAERTWEVMRNMLAQK
jgi:glycosyltransferase involved in cell wall biosynthesis